MKRRVIATAALAAAFAPLCISQALNDPVKPGPASSLEAFRLGERLMRQQNYQSAAIQFQNALIDDREPSWTVVWSHIDLGLVFDFTGQRDRAKTEYQQAIDTKDDTLGAQSIAKAGLMTPGQRPDVTPIPADLNVYVQPKILTKTEPQYTQEALLARLEGTVTVATSLGPDGRVLDVRAQTPLGLGLDEAAVDAVRQWTFAPATRQGLSIPDVAFVDVNFRLPGLPGWHVSRIEFAPPAQTERPTLTSGTAYIPDKMPADLAEEASLDKAIGRVPQASVSIDIDAAGKPDNIKVTSASLAEWGDDAVRAISAWRFTAGSALTPCTIELLWFPAK